MTALIFDEVKYMLSLCFIKVSYSNKVLMYTPLSGRELFIIMQLELGILFFSLSHVIMVAFRHSLILQPRSTVPRS